MSRITPFFGPILCRESRCLGDTFQPTKKWWVTQGHFLRGLSYPASYSLITDAMSLAEFESIYENYGCDEVQDCGDECVDHLNH